MMGLKKTSTSPFEVSRLNVETGKKLSNSVGEEKIVHDRQQRVALSTRGALNYPRAVGAKRSLTGARRSGDGARGRILIEINRSWVLKFRSNEACSESRRFILRAESYLGDD